MPTTTQVATGVRRVSPAQIDALYGVLMGAGDDPMEPTNQRRLSVFLDLVQVDGVEVLRVFCGETAITIGASGKVQEAQKNVGAATTDDMLGEDR